MKMKTFFIPFFLAGLMALHGCNNSERQAFTSKTFTVTVTNLTQQQPLSPLALIVHNSQFSPWMNGSAASNGLEMLAEEGDNRLFIDDARNNVNVFATASSNSVIAPGEQASVQISILNLSSDLSSDAKLSVASMLVNTNDAFTGIDSQSIATMKVGDTLKLTGMAYDAGTERNDELQSNIPGPAAGGEGYNAQRNDNNRVHAHPGVISVDDGLTTSILTQAHRFDNPVASISIRRDS